MISLLGSYAELLNKLDNDEQIKHITKAIKFIKKESTLYEQQYVDIIKTIKKLGDIKSRILKGDSNFPYVYPILEEDSEEK